MGDFAHAADLEAFNIDVRTRAQTLARRRNGGAIQGHYWLQVDELPDVHRSAEIGTWEEIVAQIAPRSDFAGERFFSLIEGLLDVSKDKLLCAKKNLFKLRPGRDYDRRSCRPRVSSTTT